MGKDKQGFSESILSASRDSAGGVTFLQEQSESHRQPWAGGLSQDTGYAGDLRVLGRMAQETATCGSFSECFLPDVQGAA